ncbi:conserved hypothetical protein [Hyphomicrobiales bacterium]|nr:conserved hypothetical protein [Hyphomicrobiales bacterium]CAH1681329.1 conserved hypothetical protein [Hyphomicrobiales bacterium]
MTAPRRLSNTMLKVLRNIGAGRSATDGFPGGRSMSGGLSGTFVALYRRGLIRDEKLTDAGREALRREDERL